MPSSSGYLKTARKQNRSPQQSHFVAQIAMVLVHVENSSRCCLGLDLSSFEEFEE